MFTNLGNFADLEKVLEFSPPAKPSIDTVGLIKLFGQLPKFPKDFEIKRGKSFSHDGVKITELSVQVNRAKEYPPITDYIDGVVKNDQAQIDKYIADCLAVKAKYLKV